MGNLLAFMAVLFSLASLPIALVALSMAGGSRRRFERIEAELFHLRRAGLPAQVPIPPPPAALAFPPPPPPQLSFALAAAVPVPAPAIAAAPPALVEPPARPPTAEAPASFEERVALVWFTRIGALILLLGFGFFFKYATDSGWVGPSGRLLVGTVVGAAVLAGAELARARTRPIFLHVVSGVGLGILYLVAWASHVLYGVASVPVAFAGFAAVTLAGGVLAVRNRAELVLVFSLVGGFLAPILLSSGADQPLALFGYVVVLTALAFVAAVRLDFRIAPWVAIGGTVVLTLGWMLTRFSASGEYATLASRWPALLGVTAVTAEWLLVAGYARRRPVGDRVTPSVLVLCALGFAHLGAGVLLHDHPPLLGGVAALLAGLGASLVLRTMPRGFLAIPMGAATLALVVAEPASLASALELVAGTALAMAIYGVALLRDQWRDGKRPDLVTLGLASAGSGAFTLIAAASLLHAHPHAFAVVVVAVAGVQAILAMASQRPWLGLASTLVAAIALAAASGRAGGDGAPLVAIAGTWTIVVIGAIAWELFVLRLAPSIVRLVTAVVATFALPLLIWHADRVAALGALAHMIPGVAALALAATGAGLIAKTRADGITVIAGGLGLAVVALAPPITGASWVMVAMIFAAVVVALGANARHASWLLAGVVVSGVVLLGWLPAEVAVRPLHLPFVLNVRAAMLATSATALLAAAYACARARIAWATQLLTIAGHGLTLILLLTEAANLVRDDNTLLMTTTLVLGGYAALLVVLGFGARDKLHRYLGLGLFAITLGKLGLVDVWSLERVYQMLVLLGIGGLLVIAGFLYARFGRRLVALLRD